MLEGDDPVGHLCLSSVSQDVIGEEKRILTKPLIVIIKTAALDFIQHLHPHFGSQKSVLIPKALASACSCTVGSQWLSRELSTVPFLGLGSG